jgi:hypothetical protein
MLPSSHSGRGHGRVRITYNMFNNIKRKYLRRKAKNKLKEQYEYLVEVNTILEEYLTEKLLGGGDADFMAKGRKQLADKQGELKSNKDFIEFLTKIQ